MRFPAPFLCAVAALATGQAMAAFDLRVTEMYFGQEDPDVTEDWFEVTNLGDSAWIAATHGELWYDDDSADWEKADVMSGIDYILPGQSVVYVEGDVNDFYDAWSNVPGVRAGTHAGSGLGTSGDAVSLWIGTPTATNLAFAVAPYPNAGELIALGMIDDGATYDAFLAEFSTVGNSAGALGSARLGGGDGILPATVPSVGSPGAIPEPSAALLLLGVLAGLGAGRARG